MMDTGTNSDRRWIVGIGEALWDVLPEGRKIGGAPANFAYHVSQFGFPGCAVSAVGDDEPGHELRRQLAANGVQHILEEVPFPTGTVQVTLDAAGKPAYEIRREVAWDNIPFTAELEALARQTRAVCFGSLAQRSPVSRQTIARFLETMPGGQGQYRIFDINLRQRFYTRDIVDDSLRRCNILKINDEELEIVGAMFGLEAAAPEERCRALLEKYGLGALILTCGADGSHVFTPGGMSYVATPRVEVADTVGAGDSFTAAFLSALLAGCGTGEAHRLAVEVSAHVCTCCGAMPELPERFTGRLRKGPAAEAD